ncbi:cupin-like domain-containing protein [Marinagarivorans algicola]|uniref:cupin-like domain-containing protein n=1 Tax=Marinagarivorans algicola TaxID=1513270 RepID=UPI0006B646EB|nr:cupin-like domain-containing protein [Marinagarivorans algicola]
MSKESVLKVLDCTKTNKKWYDDKGLIAGYHTVSIQGERFKGQRDPEMRIEKMKMDFSGLKILDVGCSNGGILHALSDEISLGVGVDFNPKCINAANALKAANYKNNIHFYTFDLDKDDLSLLQHFIFGQVADVCFFFNLSIWIKRWKEVFALCAEMSKIMLFEAHGSEQQQSGQLAFVRSIYGKLTLLSEQSDDDPTYAKRKMYRCEGRIVQSYIENKSQEFNLLQEIDEVSVRNTYTQLFPNQPIGTLSFYPGTHESVVVDVNDEYIVKIPRPRRGIDGLLVEQAVTDLMRSKLDVQVPEVSIYSSPIVLARYRKLPGKTFDKQHFSVLSIKDKQKMSRQLAAVFYSFHSVNLKQVRELPVSLAPSWSISCDLIKDQLGDSAVPVISDLVPQVIRNQNELPLIKNNQVFGHFDLHGSNILVDSGQKNFTGLIDFGNCRVGDFHQDLSVMNLSSPELTDLVITEYIALSGRDVNRVLVQHYTTIFYLNLLAGLKKKSATEQFDYWFLELEKWYQYMLRDRASSRIKSNAPISSLSSDWRKWLASNVMKGTSTSSLLRILRDNGYSAIEVMAEIVDIEQHPITLAGTEFQHQLAKRNWLLATCNALASLDARYSSQIERRKTPSAKEFLKEYYSKHLPVVLTGGVDHWAALEKWRPSYLLEHFGDKEIEVQYGRESDPLFERNAGKLKKKMLMKDYVSLVEQGQSNDFYMTANNTKNSFSSISSLFDDVGDFGEGYRDPDTLQSGNFFWFGPKGTFTPIHHDLTNNMLVQIYGRKKITLIPAMQVPWLYNDKGVYSQVDFLNCDERKFPDMKNAKPVEVILNPGEAIFIPIGWWHCVEALDVSISSVFTNFKWPNTYSAGFPRG